MRYSAISTEKHGDEVLPATGHDWGEPEYEWSKDMKTLTATRVCMNDPKHVDTETAKTTSEVTKEPTETANGERVYTASFKNPAFEPQTRSEVIPAKIAYHITKGDKQTWYKGSSETADFTFKRSMDDETTYGHFKELKVDGRTVPENRYTKASGSVIIKISPDYLKKLATGKRSVTAVFDDGVAQAVFSVAEKSDDDDGKSDDRKDKKGDRKSGDKDGGSNSGDESGDGSGGSGRRTGNVRTGDSADILTWILLLQLAGLLAAAVVMSRRRSRK